MKISRFTVNPFSENMYILWDEDTREAAIVDPGISNTAETDAIDNFILKNNLKLTHMLFTHLHLDHAFGHSHIEKKYGLKPECSQEEEILGTNIPQQIAKFGISMSVNPLIIDKFLNEKDIITIGKEEIHIIKIPGHSPGGLVFYIPESNVIIPGDILFKCSIGRTDLEGGNYNALISGIKDKLLVLPDETLVCPGHGETTTIGAERQFNSFLK